MINEPDIVRQLREEEKIGKLEYNDLDFKNKIFEFIGIKPKISIRKNHDLKIMGYDDSLKLAKKVLNELSKH